MRKLGHLRRVLTPFARMERHNYGTVNGTVSADSQIAARLPSCSFFSNRVHAAQLANGGFRPPPDHHRKVVLRTLTCSRLTVRSSCTTFTMKVDRLNR